MDLTDLPPSAYYTVAGFVVVALLYAGLRVTLRRETDQRHPEFRLDTIAGQLGLQITAGTPETNLMTLQQRHVDKGTAGGWVRSGDKTTRVRLAGTPYGRPSEFVYHLGSEVTAGLLTDTERTSFEWRLSVRVAVPCPPFEIVLRDPEAHLRPGDRLPMPLQGLGDPALDRALVLTSPQPGIGPVIAPAAAALPALPYVHVRCDGGAVHALATPSGAGIAMYHLAQLQQILEHLANLLDDAARRRVG